MSLFDSYWRRARLDQSTTWLCIHLPNAGVFLGMLVADHCETVPRPAAKQRYFIFRERFRNEIRVGARFRRAGCCVRRRQKRPLIGRRRSPYSVGQCYISCRYGAAVQSYLEVQIKYIHCWGLYTLVYQLTAETGRRNKITPGVKAALSSQRNTFEQSCSSNVRLFYSWMWFI